MSAIWVAAAGVAVNAIGAGVSAYGASKSADAIAEANADNARREQELYDRQQKAINKLSNKKMDKLSNLGNIFDRMESTGAFGSGDTLKNLRQAQADYSALAAGDFSGFENQLRQSLSDSLIATAGSGAPIGTFAGLAAQDQMNLRNQGIQTTMGISEYLSKEAYQLLGNEFGIMDQKFEVGYKLDRDKVTNMSNYALGQAATEGVGMTAYGNAGQQIGSSIVGAYNQYQNLQTIQKSNANQLEIARIMANRQSTVPNQTYNANGIPTGWNAALSNYRNSFNVPGTGSNTVSNNNTPMPVYTGLGDDGIGVLPPINGYPSQQSGSLTVVDYSGATTFPAVNNQTLPVTAPTFMDAYNTWGNPNTSLYASSGSSILSSVGAGIVGR